MNRYALSFLVRPGSEAEVARILGGYGRPRAAAAGGGRPLLRRTSVFMAGRRVVRVMEVDGDIGAVMGHLASQPEVRAVEEALDRHLVDSRDLGSPQGVRAFLDRALLAPVLHRAAPSGGAVGSTGQRCALLYPVRRGWGEQATRLLLGGAPLPLRAGGGARLSSTTVFRRDDVLVRVFDVDGDVADVLEHVASAASRLQAMPALARVLRTDMDLTTGAGFRDFLGECLMTLVTDRRVGVPA